MYTLAQGIWEALSHNKLIVLHVMSSSSIISNSTNSEVLESRISDSSQISLFISSNNSPRESQIWIFRYEMLLEEWCSWVFHKQPNSPSNPPWNRLVVFHRSSWPWRRRLSCRAMCPAICGDSGPMSLRILLTFPVNWRTDSVCKGFLPSFVVVDNRFSFRESDLSLRIVGFFWISSSWCDGLLRCSSINGQGMYPWVVLDTSTLRRMSLVQHSSCYRVSSKLSASPYFQMQSNSMRRRNLSQ